MIAKECAPSPAREETKKEITKYGSSFNDINLSDSLVCTNNVHDAEEKICRFLLNHRGWISTKRLFENLNLDIQKMLECVRSLGKTGYIDIKSNAVRANKKTKEIVSPLHTTGEIYQGVCDIIRYYKDNNCEAAATEIQIVLDKAGNPQDWTPETRKQMEIYCAMWPEVTGWGEGE